MTRRENQVEDMKNELFKVVSAALHSNGNCNNISSADWDAVYKEMQEQSVHILPASISNSIKLSDEEKLCFNRAVGINLQQFYSVLEEQSAMLVYLSEAHIPAVILKGTAAAINYPHPEYRCMGDIDVLVPLNRFEEAFCVLCKYYKPLDSLQDVNRHAGFMADSGIKIELHQYFSISKDEKQDEILDKMLYRAIPNCVYVELNGYKFPMLPPLENGVVLLAHINQHLGGGLGLRQIVDWMCYVQKYLDDEMWENEFKFVAEQIGMKKLALIVTAMCQKYLGLSAGFHWYEDAACDSLCNELMDYIIFHGNFGRKVGSTNTTTVTVIRWFRNPIRGLKIAQRIGLRTWGAYKKHHWLKPFAWIYQIIRWIKHGKVKGVNLNEVQKNSSFEKVRTDLLVRLEVTRK